MNRNCLFCFPEDTFSPSGFIVYLQVGFVFFLFYVCSCNKVYWCMCRGSWKTTFQIILKGLKVIHCPKQSSSDHFKKNALCWDKTWLYFKSLLCKKFLLWRKASNSDFYQKHLAQFPSWRSWARQVAKHPASLCYTTSPCCIWKSWPVKRLLSGGKYQWLCGIVNLFFQEKARTNWWSNQPMLAICHFCWLALSHILNYPVSIQLQPRTCPGISCGRQFIHSFIRAVFYL